MAATPLNSTSTHEPEHAFDMRFTRFSPRWVGAGIGGSVFAALAIYRGGWSAAALLGATGVLGAAYATLVEPRRPVLSQVTLRLPTLPPALDGLRIGHLSDLHVAHPFAAANTRWAVEQMLRQQPDVIAFTGDFVSYAEAIVGLPQLLGPLHAPLGMYAVPGNHDHWEGVAAVRAALEPLGIEFLLNTSRRLRWRGASFVFAGVDDMWRGDLDLDAALQGVAPDELAVLLAHAPDIADEAAARGVALQLSGHTHGGQVRLPGLGALCLPFYGVRYDAGLLHAGAMAVYVSRGLGGVPLRFNCAPEAAIITLRQ